MVQSADFYFPLALIQALAASMPDSELAKERKGAVCRLLSNTEA